MKKGEAHSRTPGPSRGAEETGVSSVSWDSSSSWAGTGIPRPRPRAWGQALRRPDRVAELPQVGLSGSLAQPSPYSPRLWRREGRAGAGREPGLPRGSPGRALEVVGERRGWGGAGALGAELGEETAPRSTAGPSPFLRPGTAGCPA